MSPSGLLVVVAPTRAEQMRLLGELPEDTPVLVVPTEAQAQAVLRALGGERARVIRTAAVLVVVPDERAVCFADRRVRLTPLEFALLQVLLQDRDRVWSMSELAHEVWSTGWVGDGAQVRAVIKRLRRKLGEAQAPVLVENVRAAGFRLVDRDDVVA